MGNWYSDTSTEAARLDGVIVMAILGSGQFVACNAGDAGQDAVDLALARQAKKERGGAAWSEVKKSLGL